MGAETTVSQNKRPAKRIPLSQIFDSLRNQICLLEYAPGTVLREQDLAKTFGVSRTPIREVLQRLAFMGLVESRNGVGTIVTDMDPDSLIEIYSLRLKISVLIGEVSPNPCQPWHIEATEKLLLRARALQGSCDIKKYWMINHEMHFIIADLIGNTPLREIWDRLYFQAARFWYGVARNEPLGVISSLCREIEEVLSAMRENDVVAIGYIERNYIAYGLRKIAAHFQNQN